MVFMLLILFSVVGSIHPACIDNHGNENQCKADLCHWCPCTKLCIPEKYGFGCESGCVGLCNDVDECTASGCIYHPTEKKCYDVDVDWTVDYISTCALNKDSKDCTKNGCLYCPCSKKCIPPQDGLDCDSGCYQFCDQVDECSARGCIYNNGSCYPWTTSNPENPRYAVNICMNETTYVHGIYYQAMDETKIKVNSLDIWSDCYCNEDVVSSRPDKELYQCEYESPDFDVSIPVREAGNYEILMHFGEIYKPVGRLQTISLNGVTIVSYLDMDSHGFASPFSIAQEFIINCNITQITVRGEIKPIVNMSLILNLKILPPPIPGQFGHATLHGIYLRKRDR